MHHIIEIKARSTQQEKVREILTNKKAIFKGIDHQIDSYFNVPNGRLKLREGNIENHLIHYHRSNQEGPKLSEVSLYKTQPESSLKKILSDALGVLVVVDKQREIYFIDNVKFHIDTVKELGTFVEIEAIGNKGESSKEVLQEQCEHFIKLLKIEEKDLVAVSYSDLLLKGVE
jgi:adenylate cyclase class 2